MSKNNRKAEIMGVSQNAQRDTITLSDGIPHKKCILGYTRNYRMEIQYLINDFEKD